MADALATLLAMIQVNEGKELTLHSKSTYCQYLDQDEIEVDVKPWYHDIKRYLKEGKYPESISENDKRTLRRLASGFFPSSEVLYKRSVDLTLLRCVDV
ncbi:hypothetical protein CR513_29642, partial [Mucuna pruriens]